MSSAEFDKVAIFSPNPMFHSALGRLERGYNILPEQTAKEWMKVSDRVREASPQEVAASLGV